MIVDPRAATKSSEKTYLVGNRGDESLDIQLGGTALLTRGISTLQTTSGFSQSSSFTQSGVLDIAEVVLIVVRATLNEEDA